MFVFSAILGIVLAGLYMSYLKKHSTPNSSLTLIEILIVAITLLLNPLIVDLIYYYGWKDDLPKKAKQANIIAFFMFFVFIGVIIFYNQ